MSNPCNHSVQELKEKILSGGTATGEKAIFLVEQSQEELVRLRMKSSEVLWKQF